MAIGTFTKIAESGGEGGHHFYVEATMVGDGAYGAGGSTGVEAALKTATGHAGLEILGVLPQALNGGYLPVWVRATNLLMLVVGNGAAPLAENGTADVSGTTFHMLFICK